jgi:NADH-quinone oxidoreductase subunit L
MGHGEGHAASSIIEGLFGVFTHPIPLISLLVAALGILLAYAMYGAKWISSEAVGKALKPAYILLSRKYFMDELYEKVIVIRVLVNGIFAGLAIFDDRVVDGAVNGVATGTSASGNAIRKIQTGQLQFYGMFIVIGLVAIAVCYYLFA